MVNPHEKSSPSKELEAMTLEAAELEKQLEAAEASEMAFLQERKLGHRYTGWWFGTLLLFSHILGIL